MALAPHRAWLPPTALASASQLRCYSLVAIPPSGRPRAPSHQNARTLPSCYQNVPAKKCAVQCTPAHPTQQTNRAGRLLFSLLPRRASSGTYTWTRASVRTLPYGTPPSQCYHLDMVTFTTHFSCLTSLGHLRATRMTHSSTPAHQSWIRHVIFHEQGGARQSCIVGFQINPRWRR